MYDRQTNSFHHYDSCGSYNTSAARSLARNVGPFLHGEQTNIYWSVIFYCETKNTVNTRNISGIFNILEKKTN